jgi:hypothetical protein
VLGGKVSDRTPFFKFGGQAPYAAPQATAPYYQQPIVPYQQPQHVAPYHHVQQPAQQPVVEQWVELYCDCCEGRIEAEEETVEVYIGKAGRSQQTGYLITVHNPKFAARYSQVPETTVVHIECLIDHVIGNICTEQADDLLAEQVMEMANELFEEWKQSYLLEGRFEQRMSDPDS